MINSLPLRVINKQIDLLIYSISEIFSSPPSSIVWTAEFILLHVAKNRLSKKKKKKIIQVNIKIDSTFRKKKY